jgi:hypothetical protein
VQRKEEIARENERLVQLQQQQHGDAAQQAQQKHIKEVLPRTW